MLSCAECTDVEELLDAVLSLPSLSISDLLLAVLPVRLGRSTRRRGSALLSDRRVDLRVRRWGDRESRAEGAGVGEGRREGRGTLSSTRFEADSDHRRSQASPLNVPGMCIDAKQEHR